MNEANKAIQLANKSTEIINCEGSWGNAYCEGTTKRQKYTVSRYPTDGGEPCPKSPKTIGVCRNARCVDRAWYGKCRRFQYYP